MNKIDKFVLNECKRRRSIDLIGKRFGRLVIKEFAYKASDGNYFFHSICDCGNEKIIRGYDMKSSKTKSCGCLRKETTKKRSLSHGMVYTGIYKSWANMKSRCLNAKNPKYHHYGGRGITVCERWMTFRNFAKDMGHMPIGTTIDRIDNNGHYEPNNCKWAVKTAQQNNKRNNIVLSHNGQSMTVAEWAEKLGVNSKKLYSRLYRGLSIPRILET